MALIVLVIVLVLVIAVQAPSEDLQSITRTIMSLRDALVDISQQHQATEQLILRNPRAHQAARV
jgi:hypothetical protein